MNLEFRKKFNDIEGNFIALQNEMDRRFDETNKRFDKLETLILNQQCSCNDKDE